MGATALESVQVARPVLCERRSFDSEMLLGSIVKFVVVVAVAGVNVFVVAVHAVYAADVP